MQTVYVVVYDGGSVREFNNIDAAREFMRECEGEGAQFVRGVFFSKDAKGREFRLVEYVDKSGRGVVAKF